MIKNIALVVCSLFFAAVTCAQSAKVMVQNSVENTASEAKVLVKWFAPGILFEEGVNIYRREKGDTDWEKLNSAPIFRQYVLPDETIALDSSLALFAEVINEGGWDTFREGSGMLELNALIKSFSSAAFATFLGVYYEDYGTAPGKTYEYRIRKYQNGRETLVGYSEPITAGPFQPGPAVPGFTAEKEKRNILLDWEVKEEQFYAINVYRKANNAAEVRLNQNPIVLSKVQKDGVLDYPSPKYIDYDVEEEVNYTYHIKGLDFFNQETLASTKKTLNLGDITPPLPPTYLQRALDTMEVQLNWVAPQGDDIKEVRLYRGPSSDGPFQLIHTTDVLTTAYTDYPEVPGPYFYYVASADQSDNEAPSRMVFADIKDLDPPLAPTGVKVATDTGKYIVSWQANAEPDLLHYRVFRKSNAKDNKGYFLLLPEFPEEARYEYRLPKNTSNPMSFYVVAVDTAENISPPSAIVTDQIPDVVGPQQPQLRSVSQEEGHIAIAWYRNVDWDIMGYNVLRADSLLPLQYEVLNKELLPPTVLQYADDKVKFGEDYLYQLEAIDSSGNKAASAARLIMYKANPESVEEGSINLNVKRKKRKKTTTLNWTPVEMPQWLGYVVFRGPSATTLRPITPLTKVLQYKDAAGGDENLYYQVKAYSNSGKIIESKVVAWKK